MNRYQYQSIPSGDDVVHHEQRQHEQPKSTHSYFIIAAIGFVTAVTSFLYILLPAYNVNVNMMGASLVRNIPFKVITHPDPPNSLWGVVTKPYPTGAFWTNLVIKNGDYPVGVLPYGVKCLETGIQISYGAWRRYVTQLYIQDAFGADLQISSYQPYLGRAVDSYDNFSVGMTYRVAGGKYKAQLVRGSPFITVLYDNATPVISSMVAKIVSLEFRAAKVASGVQYIVTLSNYQKWLIYCSETAPLAIKDNTITSPYPIKGFLRVAFLPLQNPDAAFVTLMTYVQRYPVGAAVSMAFPASNIVQLTYQFASVGTGPLLMLSLPHHNQVMIAPIDSEETRRIQASVSPLYCLKGKMKAIVGDVWKLQYNLPQIGWNYALNNKLSTSQLDDIARHLQRDVKTDLPNSTDPYGFGKEIARLARLALIADELGIADARASALLSLESAMLPWLNGDNLNSLNYDRTYGGVVPLIGLVNQFGDYGAGWYSDHHFHYGYFVYAAAVLSRLDAVFADAHRAAFDSLVRDYCNHDPTDTDFPFVRHKDFFDGHSWASGLLIQANGKGQESSSEAVNAYYAAYLYGQQTQNIDLMRFAHTMMATEVQATLTYWHMPAESDVYDALFAQNRMAGNMGSLDVTAATWFGINPEYVHGINLIPLTPATALLVDSNFALQEWPIISQTPLDSMDDEWKYVILGVYAFVDRDDAWRRIMGQAYFGPGGSRTNALYWAASRPPAVAGYNASARAGSPLTAMKSACVVNSACDAVGLTGECCPVGPGSSIAAPGTYLVCCGHIAASNLTQRDIEWGSGRR